MRNISTHHRTSAVVLAAALSACTRPPEWPADAPWDDVDAGRAAAFQAAVEAARNEQDLPGLAVAIASHRDHSLWTGSAGLAVVEPATAWQPGDPSRIGSVTKLFTAALVFQLVEEGVLTLDDPVEQWVPGWYEGVALRDLLGHSSGIVSYNYVGSFDTNVRWAPEDLVQWAWDHEPELRFVPGTSWEYSNTNYVLLGLVIEAATGDDYASQLHARLLAPLGLDLWLAPDEPDDASLVHCYDADGDDTSAVDPSFGWAAGSLAGSAADVARFLDALFLGDVLAPASLEQLVTPRGLTPADAPSYGLGAFSETDGRITLVGHTGGLAGYQTYAFTLDDPAATVVVMTNREGADLRAASGHAWLAVLDAQ